MCSKIDTDTSIAEVYIQIQIHRAEDFELVTVGNMRFSGGDVIETYQDIWICRGCGLTFSDKQFTEIFHGKRSAD